MSTLDARDARRAASVDKAFGELFTFTAKAVASGDVNLPKIADNSKPPLTLVGVYEFFSEPQHPVARGSNPDDEAQQRTFGKPSVLVQKIYLTPWSPTRGDIVTRAKDGAVYEISKTFANDRGRIQFVLSKQKAP